MSDQSNKMFDLSGNHHRMLGYSSRVMFTAVMCLVFVVVFIVVLHLYARHVLRRRRAGGRTTMNLLRIRVFYGQDGAHVQPKVGLDPAVIATLPTFAYGELAGTDGGVEAASTECTVCLSVMEKGEMVRMLPNCKHMFHRECIDMWLHSHSTCPICRTGAEPPPATPVKLGETSTPSLEVISCSCAGTSAAPASTSDSKEEGSLSRLGSSLKRMLSRGRSGRRVQGDGVEDLERQ